MREYWPVPPLECGVPEDQTDFFIEMAINWLDAWTYGIFGPPPKPPAPEGGQQSAALLACEMFRASSGAANCRLPQNLQALTRQGVSLSITKSIVGADVIRRTGIWLIDSWVDSVTIPKVSVISPDYPRPLGDNDCYQPGPWTVSKGSKK